MGERSASQEPTPAAAERRIVSCTAAMTLVDDHKVEEVGRELPGKWVGLAGLRRKQGRRVS